MDKGLMARNCFGCSSVSRTAFERSPRSVKPRGRRARDNARERRGGGPRLHELGLGPGAARQARGRADLLRLLKGQAPGSDVEGELSGAEVVDTFTTRDGRVYVRLEAEAK